MTPSTAAWNRFIAGEQASEDIADSAAATAAAARIGVLSGPAPERP